MTGALLTIINHILHMPVFLLCYFLDVAMKISKNLSQKCIRIHQWGKVKKFKWRMVRANEKKEILVS